MGSRYFKSDENTKIEHTRANIFYGCAMTSPYMVFVFDNATNLDVFLKKSTNSEVGFFLEVDSK